VVNDGREALERIKNEKYDVILLDLTLPEFSGYDILKNLKQEDLLKHNNILLFTASYISDEDIQKIISDGAKGIIKKPISIDKILESLEKYR
ncbi:MAG: response regulator, partial [Thermoproteota archaeon]|nr:response regulator [Thermoproteota archaeon]